jgi:hypothetical protein
LVSPVPSPPPTLFVSCFVFVNLTSDADLSRQYTELALVSEEIPTFVTSIIHSFGERSTVCPTFPFLPAPLVGRNYGRPERGRFGLRHRPPARGARKQTRQAGTTVGSRDSLSLHESERDLHFSANTA